MGDTHVHVHTGDLTEINRKLDKIMDTQLEFAEKVAALAADLEDTKKIIVKVGEETDSLLASIEELKTALVKADEVKPELLAAFDKVVLAAEAVKVASTEVDTKVAD